MEQNSSKPAPSISNSNAINEAADASDLIFRGSAAKDPTTSPYLELLRLNGKRPGGTWQLGGSHLEHRISPPRVARLRLLPLRLHAVDACGASFLGQCKGGSGCKYHPCGSRPLSDERKCRACIGLCCAGQPHVAPPKASTSCRGLEPSSGG